MGIPGRQAAFYKVTQGSSPFYHLALPVSTGSLQSYLACLRQACKKGRILPWKVFTGRAGNGRHHFHSHALGPTAREAEKGGLCAEEKEEMGLGIASQAVSS